MTPFAQHNNRMTKLLSPLAAQWERLAPRERLLVAWAAGLLALATVWWVLLAPALQTYRASEVAHQTVDAQLTQMQALAAEANILRSAPRMTSQEVQAWLEGSVKKLGRASLTVQGSRLQVSFSGAAPEKLAQWLTQARTQAGLIPVQANWKRSASTPATNDALWDGTTVFEPVP